MNATDIRQPIRAILITGVALLLGACSAPEPPGVGLTDCDPEETSEVSAALVSYDCGTRTDTGYTNGNAFPITVVTVDGSAVEIDTANAFLTMAAAADAAGLNMRLNSGFRTMAEQQYLYNCYINQNCNGGNLAARPGYSNHQSGHALDINMSGGVLAWMNANAATFGFERTVPSENWHWEWWGGGSPKAYCCVGASCDEVALIDRPLAYAPPSTTDLDGDGRADVCARGGAGLYCHLATNDGFGPEALLVPLSNANGWSDASNYATMRMGDVDGDGRADLCARTNATFDCWTSNDAPLSTHFTGPAWSDASGWSAAQYWSTIRLADINGDGREDVCARAAAGIVCHLSTGSAFGTAITGPAWSDAKGFKAAKYYATLRTGDINGDAMADLCVRASDGIRCALATGTGFGDTIIGPSWSDAAGWDDPLYYSSIRLADINGDGMADLCARSASDLRCHFATGTGFGPAVSVASLSDATGWADPGNAQTLRVGDIDGDGAIDLCIRSNSAVMCWAWSGDGFTAIDGPALSDAKGWNAPEYFETLRLGDADGDGKADLCYRGSAGFGCALSTGNGFEAPGGAWGYSDASGWDKRPYFSTLFFASPVCRPTTETCNGKDDNCDGLVDEDEVCDVGVGGTGGAGAGGQAAGGQAGGGWATGGQAAGGQAAGGWAGDDTLPDGSVVTAEGCSCSLIGEAGSDDSLPALLAAFVGLALIRRRRLRRV